MRFELDADERALAELAADVLHREQGQPEQTWKALLDAGVLGAALPEPVGGAGLGAAEAGLVAHAVGSHAVELPVYSTLFLGALPLAGCADAEPLLRDAAGGTVLTAAVDEPSAPLPASPATTATREGSGFVLHGTKIHVPDAEVAGHILVTATVDGAPALFAVDPHEDEVHIGPGDRVLLANARAARLGDAETVCSLHRHAVAGAAALGSGALDGALDLTVRHIGTREQFGRPIATFQTAAAQVADVSITARAMRLAATSACWRLGRGLDAELDCSVAGYWLGSKALEAVHACHHLHGGVGVDMDYPLHRHYGLIKQLAGFVGGTPAVTESMAERVIA